MLMHHEQHNCCIGVWFRESKAQSPTLSNMTQIIKYLSLTIKVFVAPQQTLASTNQASISGSLHITIRIIVSSQVDVTIHPCRNGVSCCFCISPQALNSFGQKDFSLFMFLLPSSSISPPTCSVTCYLLLGVDFLFYFVFCGLIRRNWCYTPEEEMLTHFPFHQCHLSSPRVAIATKKLIPVLLWEQILSHWTFM